MTCHPTARSAPGNQACISAEIGLTTGVIAPKVAPAGFPMARARISVSIDERTLRHLDRLVREGIYASRSRAIEAALGGTRSPAERRRFARVCAKMDPREEQSLAEEWLAGERDLWRKS